jgi:hypothetical protein
MAAKVWWESVTDWTEPLIIKRLQEIQAMGWIKVSDYVSTFEHGQIGQSIERLFNVDENNDEAPDLSSSDGGKELKTLRTRSTMWTLKHCSTYSKGMTPHEVFLKYAYPKKKRVSRKPDRYSLDPLYKRLSPQFGYNDFSSAVRKHTSSLATIEIGDDIISDYFSLRPGSIDGELEIHHRDDGYLASVDLRDKWKKLQRVVLVLCESDGVAGDPDEKFRISHAFLLTEIKSASALLKANILSCTFSMSQSEPNHYPREKNRSDKYRINLPKSETAQLNRLTMVWKYVKQLV